MSRKGRGVIILVVLNIFGFRMLSLSAHGYSLFESVFVREFDNGQTVSQANLSRFFLRSMNPFPSFERLSHFEQ